MKVKRIKIEIIDPMYMASTLLQQRSPTSGDRQRVANLCVEKFFALPLIHSSLADQ
ncbi:hypothetical protein HPP92_008345, partial [Vanilla planifolia]